MVQRSQSPPEFVLQTQETPRENLADLGQREYLVQGREQGHPMVAIGYARCSTEEQSLESMAIDYQMKRLEELCGTGNVIRDERSATKCPLNKRPLFWEAISRLRELPPGVERRLIYTRIDRIARTIEDGPVIQQLCNEGIVFQGLDSGQVMQGAQGTMMLNMALMMAQYEQQLLGEKLELKYVDRRKSKSPMNRPPFGYVLEKITDRDGIKFRLVQHPVQAIQAQQLFDALIANEGSINKTMRTYQFDRMPKSARGLKIWFQNVAHIGHTKYPGHTTRSGKLVEGELIKNTHASLVSEEKFNLVQILLGERAFKERPANQERERHPLNGILRCPCCGYLASFTQKVYRAKANGLGRHAGRYKPGELRVSHNASCRYKRQNRCDVDLTTGCFSKWTIDALKEQAWEMLIERAQKLSIHSPTQGEISKEELELMAGIKALEAIPGETMKVQIDSMKAQLDQYKFKRDGKVRAANTKVAEFLAFDIDVKGLNDMNTSEQNELFHAFIHRIVPPYKDQPAIIDPVF